MLRRFLVEPTSRLFLSVAELFKAYDQTNDCIRLLEFGLENHPTYGAARVILAREYFDQGEFEKSLTLLEKSPVSLKQNRLAQKVIFKNYILLGFYPEADEVLQRLRSFESKDEEIAQALDTIAASGHQKYRDRLMQRFEGGRRTKAAIVLPSLPELPLAPVEAIRAKSAASPILSNNAPQTEATVSDKAAQALEQSDVIGSCRRMEGSEPVCYNIRGEYTQELFEELKDLCVADNKSLWAGAECDDILDRETLASCVDHRDDYTGSIFSEHVVYAEANIDAARALCEGTDAIFVAK